MEQLKNLLIIGAGGLGRDVAWVVRRINQECPTWNLLGFLDDSPSNAGKVFNGDPVLGTVDLLKDYPDAYVVCAIASAKIRKKVIAHVRLVAPTVSFATLIDPSVILSDYVTIGEGSIICVRSVVSVNVTLGAHVIINAGCTVGHDANLSDYVTVYPGANISGTTVIGECVELGTGMQVIQGLQIGSEAIIGAGAVVVRDIPAGCTAVGCPAKPIHFEHD